MEKQQSLQRDVVRYRERRDIEKNVGWLSNMTAESSTDVPLQIALYELALPLVEYTESRLKYSEAKQKRDRVAAEYRQMEEQNKPMKHLQAYVHFSVYGLLI